MGEDCLDINLKLLSDLMEKSIVDEERFLISGEE